MSATERNEARPIDPETLAAVAREVLARLGHPASTGASATASATEPNGPDTRTDRIAASIPDRVISSETIAGLAEGVAELFVDAAAVITPSAHDEARTRGIAINRGEPNAAAASKAAAIPTAGALPAESQRPAVIDRATPDRATAMARQLAGRGIRCCAAKIILSDTPAKDLYDQCVREGEVAAMVGSIAEAQRFAQELDVTAWVLDMKRLSLTAAVNVASQIARTGRPSR